MQNILNLINQPLDTGDPKALNEGPQTTTEPKVKRTGQKVKKIEEFQLTVFLVI